MSLTNELAAYIADYVNEELTLQSHSTDPDHVYSIDMQMILEAVDAYEGGAR